MAQLKRGRDESSAEATLQPDHSSRPAGNVTYTSSLDPNDQEEVEIGAWFPVIFAMRNCPFYGATGAITTNLTVGVTRGSRASEHVRPILNVFREQDFIRIPRDISKEQLGFALLLTHPFPYIMDFQFPPPIREFHLQVLAMFNPDLIHALTISERATAVQASTTVVRETITDFEEVETRVFRIRF